MLSTKDLTFKKRPVKKMVLFTNVVKLRLLTWMRIHLVVNVSWVIRHKEKILNKMYYNSKILGLINE